MTMTGKLVWEETASDWDTRFDGGWQKAGGNFQSLQFALGTLASPDVMDALAKLTPRCGASLSDLLGIKIIDYGCALGDGTALLKVVFPYADVIGVDISAKAVEVAKSRWPIIDFKVGSILEPEEADLIWTSHTVEHFEDSAFSRRLRTSW